MTSGSPTLLDPASTSTTLDPTEAVERLLRGLKTGTAGLSSREAQRRLVQLALAALLIYAPSFQSLLATAALSPADLLFALPFPFIVWGADELRRSLIRRRATRIAGPRDASSPNASDRSR